MGRRKRRVDLRYRLRRGRGRGRSGQGRTSRSVWERFQYNIVHPERDVLSYDDIHDEHLTKVSDLGQNCENQPFIHPEEGNQSITCDFQDNTSSILQNTGGRSTFKFCQESMNFTCKRITDEISCCINSGAHIGENISVECSQDIGADDLEEGEIENLEDGEEEDQHNESNLGFVSEYWGGKQREQIFRLQDSTDVKTVKSCPKKGVFDQRIDKSGSTFKTKHASLDESRCTSSIHELQGNDTKIKDSGHSHDECVQSIIVRSHESYEDSYTDYSRKQKPKHDDYGWWEKRDERRNEITSDLVSRSRHTDTPNRNQREQQPQTNIWIQNKEIYIKKTPPSKDRPDVISPKNDHYNGTENKRPTEREDGDKYANSEPHSRTKVLNRSIKKDQAKDKQRSSSRMFPGPERYHDRSTEHDYSLYHSRARSLVDLKDNHRPRYSQRLQEDHQYRSARHISSTDGMRTHGRSRSPEDGIRTYGRSRSTADGIRTHGKSRSPAHGMRTHGRSRSPEDGIRTYGRSRSPADGIRTHGKSHSPAHGMRTHGRSRSPEDGIRAYGRSRSPAVGIRTHGKSRSPAHGMRTHGRSRSPEDGMRTHVRSRLPEDGMRTHGRSRSPEDGMRTHGRSRSPAHGMITHGRSRSPAHGMRIHARCRSPEGGMRIHGRSHSPAHGMRTHGRSRSPEDGMKTHGRSRLPEDGMRTHGRSHSSDRHSKGDFHVFQKNAQYKIHTQTSSSNYSEVSDREYYRGRRFGDFRSILETQLTTKKSYDLKTSHDKVRQLSTSDENYRWHDSRKRKNEVLPIPQEKRIRHGKQATVPSSTVLNTDLKNCGIGTDFMNYGFEDAHSSQSSPRTLARTHKSGLLGTIAFLKRPTHCPDDVAMTLANRIDELDSYLRATDVCPQIVALLGILQRCAAATLCKQDMLNVMYTLRKRNLFERKDVLEKLKEIRSSVAEDIQNDFMNCLLLVMKTMIQTVGLEEADTMITLSLIQNIMQSQQDKFEQQREQLKEIEALYTKKTKENSDFDDPVEYLARTLPILPTIKSIRDGDKISISQHAIGKAFCSEQRYVSYMYVLFREDFVRPLMSGIQTYISHEERQTSERFRNTDVRLYKDVYLVSTSTQTESGIVWRIQFQSNFSRRSYIPSVLQYGSLLCLSHDDFKSIYYATVANRGLCELRKGRIDIKFVGRFDLPDPMSETFVMLESRAFYGAYSHTLLALKNLAIGLADGEAILPLGKYLTGQTNEIEFPAYLDRCSHFSFYCLTHYGEGTRKSPAYTTELKNLETWPSASEIGLDLSQYDALKLVLTRKVALIQGPPGTGKTMMGIRMAELLLSNSRLWNGEYGNNHRPLLLVSYTNHALDQFLQLLLKTPTMSNCLPEDVVRVGSRCEVEELDEYALKRHRRDQSSRAYKARFRSLKDIERKIESLTKTLSDYQANLIHEDTFIDKKVMTRDHYTQLRGRGYFEKYLPLNNTMLWKWLDIESFLSAMDLPCENEFFNDHAVTMDDMVHEDMWRMLDQDDDDPVSGTIYHNPWSVSKGPRRAIDEKILREDPYFQRLNHKQRNLILRGIYDQLEVRGNMSSEAMSRIQNIWSLDIRERWRLYRYWVHSATQPLVQQLRYHETQYEVASHRYCEARDHLDCQIMKKASVVAMTTTAAARYTRILKEVGSPIVIIEEAAQVSEQHALGALSPACQHLIMIGDHQQLKPAYNDYSLAKTYHTDVSLFERLVRIKFPYQRLQNQHRMRPEISTLLVPHIYETLSDDASVFGYPNVRGVASNVFFITHNEHEDTDDESLSHSNTFEAEFLTKLYRHLRLQGYHSSEITILALYKDQVQVLRRLIREIENTDLAFLKTLPAGSDAIETQTLQKDCGVRITPVDNFQGEENKIILLSLVRSNKACRIGHLAAPNRVCVSLSRAKEGFYVIGNMTRLREASSLWGKIVSKAEEKGICGKYLELKCSKHPNHKMFVEMAKDFEAFKDGGCSQKCDTRLQCGHTCGRTCHTDDPEHLTPCQKPVVKYCPRNHGHTRKCDQPIGKCRENIEVDLPKCGHKTATECFQDIRDVRCTERCQNKLPCGHVCQRYCGEDCNTEKDCNELVKVTRKCGHTFQTACCTQRSGLCTVKCISHLECGHPCRGTCGECHAGRLHKPCKKKCERKLICGHPCKADCTEVCPPCSRPCPIQCIHNRCKKQCGEVCTLCKEPCKWECRRECQNHFKCTKWCFELCNRERCDIPCSRTMPCGHQCIALNCEKCVCRECDQSEFEIFFGTEGDATAVFYRLPDCRHIFEVTSLDTYMDGDTSAETIAMKVCPRCTSPIWNSERYGNIIRQRLKDIDVVKSKLLSKDAAMSAARFNMSQQFSKIEVREHMRFFEESISKTKNTAQLDAVRMQFGFYTNVKDTMKNLSQIMGNDYINQDKGSELEDELISLLDWVLIRRFRFSEQELREFKMELTRIRLCYRTLMMQKMLLKKEGVPEEDQEWVNKTSEKLCSGTRLVEEDVEGLEQKLKELETQHPRTGLMITEEERIMILRAMDFGQKGHWYKCKNGHVYAIGDCGGAMVESKCPHCDEVIGGERHRLRGDNSVATEMDGARYSVWSDQANMENYVLIDEL